MAGWLGKLADDFRAGLEQESPKESRPVDSAVEPRYLFRADGAVYRVRFEGEARTIARLKGAMYIYEILQHPNRIYPSSELHALAQSPIPKR